MWLVNRKWRRQWCMSSFMPSTTPLIDVISIPARVWHIQVSDDDDDDDDADDTRQSFTNDI